MKLVFWHVFPAYSPVNPITWKADGGLKFNDKAKFEIFKELEKAHISIMQKPEWCPCSGYYELSTHWT